MDDRQRIDVAIGLVMRHGQILICRRKSDTHLAGLWEFPGGKREPGESLQQCLLRELDEELGIHVRVESALSIIEHDYPTVHVRLHPFLCLHESGEPRAIGCDEVRWIEPNQLPDYPFPPANDALLSEAIGYLRRAQAPHPG